MQTSTSEGRTPNRAARLRHERRSESSSVPVRIPLQTVIAGRRFRGSEISIEHFALDDYVEELKIGESGWYDLDLEQGGWVLTVKVQAALASRSAQKRTSTFEILEMAEADREVLRRELRCHLTGEKLSLTDFADERPFRAAVEHAGRDGQPFARGFRLFCFGAGGVALVGLLGLSIFEQTMTTKARFATVTAPMIELRAPSSGQIGAHDFKEATG